MEKSKGAVVVPSELINVLADEPDAKAFFDGLSDGYKRGYCDWVGGNLRERPEPVRRCLCFETSRKP